MIMDYSIIESIINKRPGLYEALEYFEQNYNIILVAPTSYGKTVLSIKLLEIASENNISSSLIHIAPYRALVREIYEEKFKPHYRDTGWQMHGEIDHYVDKSPYFLRDLVVTTLDSFVYNLYRIPVAEMRKIIAGSSQGHYYPVLASIFTSTIVFDEAHIYLNDTGTDVNESIQALYAALEYLSTIKIPVVVETATMKSDLIAKIAKSIESEDRRVKILYVGSSQRDQLINKFDENSIEFIKDDDFVGEQSFKWFTKLEEENRVFEIVREYCSSNPILIIRNTVRKAIETYDVLKNSCEETVLIHGLLSNRDRSEAVSKAREIIKDKRRGLIITTQVVEAGVEIGGSILVSDPAPVENLAQRSGRLCRETYKYSKLCREEGASIYIIKNGVIGPYSENIVNTVLTQLGEKLSTGKEIDWRLFENRNNYISFTKLLEEIKTDQSLGVKDSNYSRRNILNSYLNSDATPNVLIELMKYYNLRLIDRGYLITIAVPQSSGEIKEFKDIELVSVDLYRLLSHEVKKIDKNNTCLEYVDNKPQLLVKYPTGEVEKKGSRLDRNKLINLLHMLKSNKIINLIDYIDKFLTPQYENNYSRSGRVRKTSIAEVYLLAKPDCYERGRGLKIWD